MSTKALINIKTHIQKRVVFFVSNELNPRTQKLLEKVHKDLKTGKNATKPLVYGEAVSYLDSL
jgi:hypothetical protein